VDPPVLAIANMLNILIIMDIVGPVPRAPVALLLESAIADGAQRGNM